MTRRSLASCLVSLAFGIGIGASLPGVRAAPAPRPAPEEYSRYQKLDLLARTLSIVEQYYVRPVDDTALVHAAIRGITSELDPHTSFLAPREAKLLREDIEGAFGGIGLTVVIGRTEEGDRYLDVRDVIPDGPAAKGGIRAGYRITAIEGQPVSQLVELERAIAIIRGEPGTSVRITVEDPATGIIRSLELERAIIDPPAVEVRDLGDGYGVLRLREFSEGAAREVKEGIAELRRARNGGELNGVVLDLRDNGGGLLDEAVAIVDLFVDDGVIVRTRGRRGRVLDEQRAHRLGTETRLPLVVLMNKASASASEIVAGALQDHRRALIVGERSYGKGSVQAPFALSDGSVLKLTTALYFTPNDRLIQASGIAPDVFVGETEPGAKVDLDSRPELEPERAQPRHLEPADFGRPTPPLDDVPLVVRNAGGDVQLRTAIEHLRAWDHLRLGRAR